MKVKSIHRITALIMAFLMLFASVGFSVDLHYCKGDLKSFSIIGEAASCHSNKKSCPNHSKSNLEEDAKKQDCCSNKKLKKDNLDKDSLISSSVELTDTHLNFIGAFTFVIYGYTLPKVVLSTFLENVNPLPPWDIYVLLESYLL